MGRKILFTSVLLILLFATISYSADSDELIMELDFDEGSSNVVNRVNTSMTAPLTGGATYTTRYPSYATSGDGSPYAFELPVGSSAYASFATTTPKDGSLTVWVNGSGGDAERAVYSTSDAGGFNFLLLYPVEGYWRLYLYTGGGSFTCQTQSVGYLDDVYHFLAVRWNLSSNNDRCDIWYDGAFEGRSTGSEPIASFGGETRIGQRQNGGQDFEGDIDELRVYKTWISNETIASLYNYGTDIALDETPPTYTTLQNNASSTTQNNGFVNFSIVVTDETESSNITMRTNITGTWESYVDSLSGLSQTFYFINQTSLTKSDYACANFTIADTSNNINNTGYTCFTVANSLPTISLMSPPDDDHNNLNLTVVFTPNDVDSDELNCSLWINDSLNVYNDTIDNGVSTILTSVDLTINGPYDWFLNCSDPEGFVVSETRGYVLDTVNPILRIDSPLNNSWHMSSFEIDVAGIDNHVYILNYTMYNSSHIISSQQESTIVDSYLDLNNTIDVAFLGISNGTYYINFSVSDRHTDTDVRGLEWSYFNGTITFYKDTNPNKKLELDFGYYSGGEVKKLTSTQIQNYDVKKIVNREPDRYEFGANFTLPNTGFIFGFRFRKPNNIVLVDAGTGHFIIHDEYWMDYKLDLVIDDVSYRQTANVQEAGNYYYVYWNIDWESYGLQANDRVTFITRSIGGLNIVEKQYVINIGTVSYPALSNINCTNFPGGDTTERYDTYANSTPTFVLQTDIQSDGFISADNETWEACSPTGGTSHTCTLPEDQKIFYGNQTIYALFNNTMFDNRTYDIWDVFGGYYFEGNVTDTDGNLINNALVQGLVNNTDTVGFSTRTNSTGDWIVGLPVGGDVYTVIAYEPNDKTLGGAIKPFVEVVE